LSIVRWDPAGGRLLRPMPSTEMDTFGRTSSADYTALFALLPSSVSGAFSDSMRGANRAVIKIAAASLDELTSDEVLLLFRGS
jgi:hypothetical protein